MALSDFQESKEIERIIFSWPVIFVCVLLLLAALWGVFKALEKGLALRQEVANLEKKIAEAESAKNTFQAKLENLRTEAGLDREARGRFNLKKPGEGVVIFVENQSQAKLGGFAADWLASLWSLAKGKFGF